MSNEILRKLGDSLEIEPDEIENPQPLKVDYGAGEIEPARLREAPDSAEYWRRRALDAESKLSILRAGVHGLAKTVEGVIAASPPPSSREAPAATRVSSSASVEQAAGAMDLAEELAEQPPPESPPTRKVDAPSGGKRGPGGGAGGR